ncbi:MAG: CxxC motif-containing protein (DUF1111 family) [Arenicella sp.]|jgi:CxxC motif-containing protein (DUF1111 family)
MMTKYLLFIFVFSSITLSSCKKLGPGEPLNEEVLDGPLEDLTAGELSRFIAGDEAFGDVFTASEGLGPVFVSNQCASCHAGDGKGSEFVKFFRFGQADTNGNQFLSEGGPQLQHLAIPGYEPETLPSGATYTELVAPAVTGLGFLDAVSDANLIALSDPSDLDADGISGRVHWNNIPSYVDLRPGSVSNNGRHISRFGKKAGAYDLRHQTSGAYNEDMGITSVYEPKDVYSGDNIEPEVDETVVNDVVFYLKTLKAPIQRNADNSDVLAGEALFSQIDCAKCHMPVMQTGDSDISALAFKEFYPYTDMLLHDMGAGLDDGYTEGYATTSEWRTPALWGLGLSKDAQGGQYILLHDGRAKSLDEAIMLHGGESDQSRSKYSALSQGEKDQLIKFLESL